MTTLISNTIDFMIKSITRDKKGHFTTMKGSSGRHNNHECVNAWKQNQNKAKTESKGEIDNCNYHK